MKKHLLTIICALTVIACTDLSKSTETTGNAREEIKSAEKAFEKMAAEKGIQEAFWFYADSNAVIKRGNDSLVHGKEGIHNFYSKDLYKMATVNWSPDFIEVSAAGDLGYTYGNYRWQIKDSTGKSTEYKGVFHTVWKKQHDGTWKYVWD
jgi:ketosteroid isomerase-like protein